MVETRDHFVSRLQNHGRKHAKMTSGYATRVTKDGMIVAVPKRRRSGGLGVLKLIALMVIGFMSFKVFTLASVGPITYNERIAKLESGTAIEKVGAKALAIDPVTEAVVETVAPVLR